MNRAPDCRVLPLHSRAHFVFKSLEAPEVLGAKLAIYLLGLVCGVSKPGLSKPFGNVAKFDVMLPPQCRVYFDTAVHVLGCQWCSRHGAWSLAHVLELSGGLEKLQGCSWSASFTVWV